MKKLNFYRRNSIVVVVVIAIAYLFVFLLLPVTIDNTSVPTLVNGITTSMSIIIGFGGAMTGIVFRGDINKGDSEAKKTYLYVLGLFIIPLIYPWGAYLALTTRQFEFAVKYSFGGYLVALLVIIMVYILIARRWDLEEGEKSEKKESEMAESDKPKPEGNKYKTVNAFVDVS